MMRVRRKLWAGISALAAAALLAAALGGCSGTAKTHPGLQVDKEALDAAIELGLDIKAAKRDPFMVFRHSTQQVNIRLTGDVVVREAACCWPEDEVAYAVARAEVTSPGAAERVAQQTRRQAERELRFWVVMELAEAHDPSGVEFVLKTHSGQEYPPLVVETPVRLQDLPSGYGGTHGAAVQLGYNVRFPTQGSPGYPPIGPGVRELYLVIKEGVAETSVKFPMPETTWG